MKAKLIAFFEVDGERLPADQCGWAFFRPCGCAMGLTTIDNPLGFLVAEEAAWRQWESDQFVRNVWRAEGATADVRPIEECRTGLRWVRDTCRPKEVGGNG